MYIWKIEKLNQELIVGELSQKEQMKYLVANTAIYSLAMIQYSNPNTIDTWSGVLAGIIALVGVYFIYHCNGGACGRQLLIRYLSVGWIVFIRMFALLMLPSIIVLFALQETFMGGVLDESTTIDLIYLTAIEVIYILWVAKHINKIARSSHA